MIAPLAQRKSVEKAPIRAEQIDLVAADGALMVSAGIVVAGDDFPEIVTWDCYHFVRDISIAPNTYRLVRPYHIGCGA